MSTIIDLLVLALCQSIFHIAIAFAGPIRKINLLVGVVGTYLSCV